MKKRVPTAEVVRLMEEVMTLAGLQVPNRLHVLVAERTGLHPTTVMRYHLGRLESADTCVHDCLCDIKRELEHGEQPFADPLRGNDDESREQEGYSWHSGQAARAWFERVIEYMEDPPPQVLYGRLSEQLGISIDEIEHYHQSGARAVPVAVVRCLRELFRCLRGGDPVVLHHRGIEVVPRRQVAGLIDSIASLGVMGTGTDLTAGLADLAGLDADLLGRIASGESGPLVEARLYRILRAVHDWLHYDPRRHYEIGDVLYLDEVGPGRVVQKCHKARILVQFENGTQRLLREDIPVDPLMAYQTFTA